MILETVASFASIIGLSMQLVDKYPEDVNEAMSALKAMSVTGQTWKEVHTRYHAIERNINTVLSPIEEISNGVRRTLPTNQVNAHLLRQSFFDANWQNYIESHEAEIKPFIDTLNHAANKAAQSSEQVLSDLRDKGALKIAEKISVLVINQEKIVELHREFVGFLRNIKNELSNETWGEQQIELVLQNRELLRTRLPMIIGNTDRALMAILDLYNEIISEV